MQVVDGQQRLLTLTLLATSLYREALANGRTALGDRIRADFLETIDYESDEPTPRIMLADPADNRTLARILAGEAVDEASLPGPEESLSRGLLAAYQFINDRLHRDLAVDPFRRLGMWNEFLDNRLQFALFIHPDPSSAYRVFEVINTRGKQLTTADLLKNYLLSQTAASEQDRQYSRWQAVAKPLADYGPNTFVQFIRHLVTVRAGHVLPKDLFDYLAQRRPGPRPAPPVNELLDLLTGGLPLYLQMIDPSLEGPAKAGWLRVFGALGELNVIAVRPLLVAISEVQDPQEGMERVLELVVRRIVVGNLGTGNVERRLSDAARSVYESKRWEPALHALRDLNPSRFEFESQLGTRSFNKGTLEFLRRSIVQRTKTPTDTGYLHLIRPRHAAAWDGFNEDEVSYWGSTIGNSLLTSVERRPFGALTWAGAQNNLITKAVEDEWSDTLQSFARWGPSEVAELGRELARVAVDTWYDDGG